MTSNVVNASCASNITSKNRVAVTEEIPDEIGPSVASDDSSAPSTSYNTPAQDKLEKEIKEMHEKIDRKIQRFRFCDRGEHQIVENVAAIAGREEKFSDNKSE